METNLKEANRKLKILERNGIRVDGKLICLGSQFNFDFTWVQKLNRKYHNEIERLEKVIKVLTQSTKKGADKN